MPEISLENISSWIKEIKEAIKPAREQVNILVSKPENSTWKLAINEERKFKFINECLAIINPAINGNMKKLDNVIANINLYLGENWNIPEIIAIKSEIKKELSSIKSDIERMEGNWRADDNRITENLIKSIWERINKLS